MGLIQWCVNLQNNLLSFWDTQMVWKRVWLNNEMYPAQMNFSEKWRKQKKLKDRLFSGSLLIETQIVIGKDNDA